MSLKKILQTGVLLGTIVLAGCEKHVPKMVSGKIIEEKHGESEPCFFGTTSLVYTVVVEIKKNSKTEKRPIEYLRLKAKIMDGKYDVGDTVVWDDSYNVNNMVGLMRKKKQI